MVTVKGAFALDLLLDREWHEYAKENGIEYPWSRRNRELRNFLRENKKETTTTIKVGDTEIEVPCTTYEFREPTTTFEQETFTVMKNSLPSDEERVAYRRKEYLWKGERILPQVSWEEFAAWVKVREGIELVDFLPCAAKGTQCNLFCHKWEECQSEEVKRS